MGFKKDFVWGAATSSYQIEGAAFESGKGATIWDDFCKDPGRIFEGHNGEVACDHYHRYKEDVKLMAEMGLKAYRFSVCWTRVLPCGTGEVNQEGLDFYSNLVDELLANGITPYVTLYHWEFPSELHKKGGWLNPESPEWFAEYVRTVAQKLGNRVKHFFTINEPQMVIGNSFVETGTAPGYQVPEQEVIVRIHNLLLAHGWAVQEIRKVCPDGLIGYAPCSGPAIPETENPEDIAAARELFFKTGDQIKDLAFSVSWYSDPVMLGRYPQDGLDLFGKYLPKGWEEDLKVICQPLDFYGQNIYDGVPVRTGVDGKAVPRQRKQGYARTALGWAIDPEALYWGPKFLTERYQKPFYITENGLSCHDAISFDGKVHDPNRINFLQRYLQQYQRAADEGIDVAGYFQWSLMDNFEWSKGYHERFGLVYVDYETQERIRKDSSYWYSEVIRSNGRCL